MISSSSKASHRMPLPTKHEIDFDKFRKKHLLVSLIKVVISDNVSFQSNNLTNLYQIPTNFANTLRPPSRIGHAFCILRANVSSAWLSSSFRDVSVQLRSFVTGRPAVLDAVALVPESSLYKSTVEALIQFILYFAHTYTANNQILK